MVLKAEFFKLKFVILTIKVGGPYGFAEVVNIILYKNLEMFLSVSVITFNKVSGVKMQCNPLASPQIIYCT